MLQPPALMSNDSVWRRVACLKQRSRSAREAIKTMTELVSEYGYASEGESFSLADKDEVWIMEMIGKVIQHHHAKDHLNVYMAILV